MKILLRELDSIRGRLADLIDREAALREALNDNQLLHITDRHGPRCHAHGHDEHDHHCCAWRRAQAALIGAELAEDDPCLRRCGQRFHQSSVRGGSIFCDREEEHVGTHSGKNNRSVAISFARRGDDTCKPEKAR